MIPQSLNLQSVPNPFYYQNFKGTSTVKKTRCLHRLVLNAAYTLQLWSVSKTPQMTEAGNV